MTLASTVRRLSDLSRHSAKDPYVEFQWPDELEPGHDWFTTPEYLSLVGTGIWPTLSEERRKSLSFHEAANFYSLNIHGEKTLLQGLSARLYRSDMVEVSPYLHHFIDEENKHSVYFGGFCTRYAKVYRNRQFSLGVQRLPQDVEDFLFFAKTLIFEEVGDHYNWVQMRDDRLHPLARRINRSHHVEEARHLLFGRALVTDLWQHQEWSRETVRDVRDHLVQYFVSGWKQYYNPDVYADAGLTHAFDLAEEAWYSPVQRAHRKTASAKCEEFLVDARILPPESLDVC
ncbi:diiron oxygenase [Streptomyces odontomachi]|uniref:diiron oxygenase n=1 Tax=Streptomyces odontomachi TaxID=2944940 RepID=UPI00210ACF75|nr:diiron oxygenase [Streptomyces sp. ODS25]